jgi:serine/threonine-protein kinase HipA
MAKTPAILGVHLLEPGGAVRVGTLVRDADGVVAFTVGETYLRDDARPILSLSWYDPDSPPDTRQRLASRADKIGLHGNLPPWFAGLLPEGALRGLVMAEMGPGDHDQFDLLTRLGADLPGAILVVPETDTPASAGPLRLERVHGFIAPQPEGVVKFSLAGVQLKFTAVADGERVTVPGSGVDGRYILKVASDRYPGLPEAEMAAMKLASAAGVTTARCELVPVERIEGIPSDLLKHGPNVLAVERFDRGADGARSHIEDAGQIIGAIGERKYTMATTETVLNMVRRFSTDHRADILEAIRRVTVDVLVGNGDNHLKNWSFHFPTPGEIRLSPAYDIVPTVLYISGDQMALRFVGTHQFDIVNLRRFARVANFLRLDEEFVVGEVVATIHRALDSWPLLAPTLLDAERAQRLLDRFTNLPLVLEAS